MIAMPKYNPISLNTVRDRKMTMETSLEMTQISASGDKDFEVTVAVIVR